MDICIVIFYLSLCRYTVAAFCRYPRNGKVWKYCPYLELESYQQSDQQPLFGITSKLVPVLILIH